MTDFDDGLVAVEGWFQPVIPDGEFSSCEKGKDGGFSDSSVSDDDDGFIAVGVFGDACYAVFDHLFDFEEVEGIVFHLNSALI